MSTTYEKWFNDAFYHLEQSGNIKLYRLPSNDRIIPTEICNATSDEPKGEMYKHFRLMQNIFDVKLQKDNRKKAINIILGHPDLLHCKRILIFLLSGAETELWSHSMLSHPPVNIKSESDISHPDIVKCNTNSCSTSKMKKVTDNKQREFIMININDHHRGISGDCIIIYDDSTRGDVTCDRTQPITIVNFITKEISFAFSMNIPILFFQNISGMSLNEV